jgi:hypothetical protein
MALTARGTTSVTLAKIGTSLSLLIAACSTASTQSPDASASNSTPPGTTPTSPTLVGCEPEEPGCFATLDGKPYTVPTTATCEHPGTPASGKADAHCNGVTPQTVSAASCNLGGDAGPIVPPSGPCSENGSEYGATMNGTEGDDDDCKYHVSYTATPICENDGVYFTVTASYLTGAKGPLTGACTLAELCWNIPDEAGGGTAAPEIDGSPYPGTTGMQQVVEGPAGTYTVGPVEFTHPGAWTVRFHFNEICCDVAADSPHGHAAFLVDVP